MGGSHHGKFHLFLHGNGIARHVRGGIAINGNWATGTTRARLKAVVKQAGYSFEIRCLQQEGGMVAEHEGGHRVRVRGWRTLQSLQKELDKKVEAAKEASA